MGWGEAVRELPEDMKSEEGISGCEEDPSWMTSIPMPHGIERPEDMVKDWHGIIS